MSEPEVTCPTCARKSYLSDAVDGRVGCWWCGTRWMVPDPDAVRRFAGDSPAVINFVDDHVSYVPPPGVAWWFVRDGEWPEWLSGPGRVMHRFADGVEAVEVDLSEVRL